MSSMSITVKYKPSDGIFWLGGEYSHNMKFTITRNEKGQATGLLIEPLTIPDVDSPSWKEWLWVQNSDLLPTSDNVFVNVEAALAEGQGRRT